ncbi:MAG: hypothetical protein QOI20_2922 [Acidimicrobiaceae bacterium]|jgi:hypothetical protein|nr:hypothetical protein [Acidimicrobiaceae bacterium]
MADDELDAGAIEHVQAEAERRVLLRGTGPGDERAEIEHRLNEADAVISEWLDEAQEEGAAIVQQAREEAARLRDLARDQAARLRDTAERAAADAARSREQVLREAQAQAAQVQASVSEQMAAALRQADEQAAQRRRAAADEAAILLAESRARAERQLRTATEEAQWRLQQAEANASALEHRAVAAAASLQAEVGALQQQLAELLGHAMDLMPALDTASKRLAEGAAAVAVGQPPPFSLSGALFDDEVVDAEIIPDAVVVDEPDPVVGVEAVVEVDPEAAVEEHHKGLGELLHEMTEDVVPAMSVNGASTAVPDLAPAAHDDVDDEPAGDAMPADTLPLDTLDPERRRGLGRLLGRR